MDEMIRVSLAVMGNPYAKLSILDDEELAREAATAQLSCAKARHPKTQDVTQPSLFDLQNPYAKLSLIPDDEIDWESVNPQKLMDIPWKTRTEIYRYVSEAFSLPFIRTRPPELLRQFGRKVIRLSPRAQSTLRSRIAAYLPDEPVVYNRLSPKELDQLFLKLLEIADDAAALDGQPGK